MDLHAQLPVVTSGVIHWDDLVVKPSDQRVGRRLTEGTSSLFDYFEIHATTQEKGAKSRAPHAQKDIEEIIIVTEGTMKFTMNDSSVILSAGSMISIPPLAMQALENIGDGSLTYYVIMYRSRKPMDMNRSITAGGFAFINVQDLKYKSSEKGGRVDYINRPSAMCENLEVHMTQLNHKGPSHAAHAHPDAEIILALEGQINISIKGQGYAGRAKDLFFIETNELHSIENISDTPCRYIAIKIR